LEIVRFESEEKQAGKNSVTRETMACQFVGAITGDIEGSGVEEIVLRLQGNYLEIDLVPESNDICGDVLILAGKMEEKLSETEFG